VLVNATLCFFLFSWSLVTPPSAIERIARLREPNLVAAGVRYTRRVTIVWVIFFVANGSIALYTATLTPLCDLALYNGFIAYLLIGATFGVEFVVRSIVPAESVRDRKPPHCIVGAGGGLDRLLRQRRFAVSMAESARSGPGVRHACSSSTASGWA